MRALLFETRTGEPVIDLEVASWSYDTGILAADQLRLTVPGYTPRARSMDLRDLLTPYKHAVALVDDSVSGDVIVPAVGFIAAAPANEDTDGLHKYDVTCSGFERLWDYRHVRLFPGWPLIGGNGKPTSTYDQSFQNLSYGTIIKRLVSESMKFPGGDLPLEFEADRSGIHERTSYEATDGKSVLDAVDDITELLDGVEYDLQPSIDEFDKVTLRLVTGTDAGRVIVGPREPVWNIGGKRPDVRGWSREPSPVDVATDAVFTGGKSDDRVLAARASDTALIDDGWPRREVWDSSHSSVSVQATLQSWATGRLQGMTELIEFEVRHEHARGVRHGDFVTLNAQGHWDMPDGSYERRVLSVARDSGNPDWVKVQLVGVTV